MSTQKRERVPTGGCNGTIWRKHHHVGGARESGKTAVAKLNKGAQSYLSSTTSESFHSTAPSGTNINPISR